MELLKSQHVRLYWFDKKFNSGMALIMPREKLVLAKYLHSMSSYIRLIIIVNKFPSFQNITQLAKKITFFVVRNWIKIG